MRFFFITIRIFHDKETIGLASMVVNASIRLKKKDYIRKEKASKFYLVKI